MRFRFEAFNVLNQPVWNDPDTSMASSLFGAIDPFTGKKVWDFPNARTGVLSTAGGLVFPSGAGGLLALDARTASRSGISTS